MSDFEELLNEVVRHEANIQPPAGMERRIALALSSPSRDRAGGRIWRYAAAAAAILIAVAGTLGPWHEQDQTSDRMLLAPMAVTLPASVSANGAYVVPTVMREARQKAIRAAVTRASPRYSKDVQLETASVQPLQIKPLVIPLIEIASLTSKHKDSIGETR